MKIEVGEYVRTRDGRIYQVNGSTDEWTLSDIFYKVIVKHSKNIIDLIEVGDYVNGYLINYIADNEKAIYHDALDFADVEKFENKDIETVVTKEQMREMEYRINE